MGFYKISVVIKFNVIIMNNNNAVQHVEDGYTSQSYCKQMSGDSEKISLYISHKQLLLCVLLNLLSA